MVRMPGNFDVYIELVYEVQCYLLWLYISVDYDWLAAWPLVLTGLKLRRALWLLRTACAWIWDHDR